MIQFSRRPVFCTMAVLGVALGALTAHADEWEYRNSTIRVGMSGSIVGTSYPAEVPDQPLVGLSSLHPEPRLAGFSPLVAITTSDKKQTGDFEFEHVSQTYFSGNALTSPANLNYIIGIVDSGSDTDLFAGSAAAQVGLTGSRLTSNAIPIGGTGGTVDAYISWPHGVFAAGLSAVNPDETLDLSQVVGHTNSSSLVAPAIECGGVEAVSGVVGRPLLSLFNLVVSVDTPREVTVDGVRHKSPAVTLQSKSASLPPYSHRIPLEFGALAPATTAIYYPDFEDFVTPMFPTMFALSALSIPTGGAFFTDLVVKQGDQSEITLRMMVDTGAQTSIISPAAAASLNLALEPDFTIDVCGVGGFTTGVPCYFVDYARVSALGGALEFSNAPFVLLDLASPEGGNLDGIIGMNMFWDRNVSFEFNVDSSAFVNVSDPLNVPWGDNDVDFDVDIDDFEAFEQAYSGDGSATAPEFKHFDYNEDGDVGLEELQQFQLAFTGS